MDLNNGIFNDSELVWSLQFENIYIFNIDTINIYIVSKYFNSLLNIHLNIFISLWKIEPVKTLSEAIKNYSRRYPTKYSIKYRNPDWVIKKAIKFNDYSIAKSVIKTGTVSIERQQYYCTWIGLNDYAYDLGDFYKEYYEKGLQIKNGYTCTFPRTEFIVLLARYKGECNIKNILNNCDGIRKRKYYESLIKTGDLIHIIKNIDEFKLSYRQIGWRLGRYDIANILQDPEEKLIIKYIEYDQLLYGGHIELIKKFDLSIFSNHAITVNGSLLLCALYSMNIECIKSIFTIGPVDINQLSSNPRVRDLGKTPGETTPEKLIDIKKLLEVNNIDVFKIKYIFLHFVMRNDDVDSVPILIQYYDITMSDIIEYASMLKATFIKKTFTDYSLHKI